MSSPRIREHYFAQRRRRRRPNRSPRTFLLLQGERFGRRPCRSLPPSAVTTSLGRRCPDSDRRGGGLVLRDCRQRTDERWIHVQRLDPCEAHSCSVSLL